MQNPEHVIRDNRVSTHSRLKAAESGLILKSVISKVSTHSRLKAAVALLLMQLPLSRFNTQPPEGGWVLITTK